jgi:hypothetical protein
MKRISTHNWLFIILTIPVIYEVIAIVNIGISQTPIIHVALLLWLFTLTMKGYRWARYFLVIFYGLGGIFAIISVASVSMPFGAKFGLVALGMFGLLSSAFLFRAKMLRELSKSLESGC